MIAVIYVKGDGVFDQRGYGLVDEKLSSRWIWRVFLMSWMGSVREKEKLLTSNEDGEDYQKYMIFIF